MEAMESYNMCVIEVNWSQIAFCILSIAVKSKLFPAKKLSPNYHTLALVVYTNEVISKMNNNIEK